MRYLFGKHFGQTVQRFRPLRRADPPQPANEARFVNGPNLVQHNLAPLALKMALDIGVLIALRTATVQEAQQNLMTATLFPLVLLQMIPLLLLNVVPDGRVRLKELVAAANPTQIILIVMAVLVVLDVGLLMAVMVRFKRARLILG